MVGLMFSLSLTTNMSSASKVEGALLCEEGVVGGGEMLLSFYHAWQSSQSSSTFDILSSSCFSDHFFPCSLLGLVLLSIYLSHKLFSNNFLNSSSIGYMGSSIVKGNTSPAQIIIPHIFKKVSNETNVKLVAQTCTNVDRRQILQIIYSYHKTSCMEKSQQNTYTKNFKLFYVNWIMQPSCT